MTAVESRRAKRGGDGKPRTADVFVVYRITDVMSERRAKLEASVDCTAMIELEDEATVTSSGVAVAGPDEARTIGAAP